MLVKTLIAHNYVQLGGIATVVAFPILGLAMLKVFREMASANEKEVRGALVSLFGDENGSSLPKVARL
jgi:hypothetical protein